MAKSDGSVRINTLVDTQGFGKGMNTMQKQIGGLTGAIGKLGLAIAATFSVGKLIQFGKEAIDLGSDLQEVQNVVDVTFTTMNEQVNEFAKNAAETAGLSETMAKRYTGTFGAMAKAFGFAENEAFDMSTSLTQLAGDVASFYNLTQDEAYTKLKSVFTGETETLKDLGVVMTQNALDSYAMAEGYGKTTKQMSEQEKVALRYSFVLDQLSAAQGDFVRTSDSWANQTRILSLNFDSFKANIGQALINIFTPFLKVLNQIVSKMAQLSQHFVAFSEMLVGRQTSGGGGSPGETLAEISGGYEEIADSTDEATKAQKKYLSGLDEIRTFTDKTSEGTEAVGSIGGINSLDINASANIDTSSFERAGDLVDRLKTKVQELTDRFPILDNVIGIVKGSFELFRSVGEDLVNLLIRPIAENKDGILEAAKNMATFTLGIVERITEGFEKFVGELNRVYDERISPVIENITDDISQFVEQFLEWFNNDMAPVLERWGMKFDEVWENHINPLLDNLAVFFGEIAENIGVLWNEKLYPFISWIATNILPVVTPIIEAVGNTVMRVFGTIADIISGLIDILSGLIDVLVGTFTGDWERVWNGIKDILGGVINSCISVFETLIDSSIDLLNGLIGGINEITGNIGIPAIPIIQEVTIPRIPMLATGAVIPPNAPFMAMLGDQKHGTNIEAPLDTIKQAVREVVGGGNGGQYSFTAQINRRTLFEEMIDEAKLRQSTSGRNPFELA